MHTDVNITHPPNIQIFSAFLPHCGTSFPSNLLQYLIAGAPSNAKQSVRRSFREVRCLRYPCTRDLSTHFISKSYLHITLDKAQIAYMCHDVREISRTPRYW